MSVHEVQPGFAPNAEAVMVHGYQRELDQYYVTIRHFSALDVTEILMALAAFHGRACEIRSTLVRNESRRAAAFRTREVEPFLDACEFQFKAFSRLQSVRQMEVDLSRGGT